MVFTLQHNETVSSQDMLWICVITSGYNMELWNQLRNCGINCGFSVELVWNYGISAELQI